ncbi:MAG TPA: hypothetical protein VGE65_04130 [Sphingobium sp.]
MGSGKAEQQQVIVASQRFPWRPLILASLALVALLLAAASTTSDIIAAVLLRQQDIFLLGLALLLAGAALLPILPARRPLVFNWRMTASVALIAAVAAYAGHHWLLLGYDFTRDEQMANFDAAIFNAGHLVWPLPSDWQAHATELNLRFMPRAGDQQLAWVSGYLPMNAAIRALFGLLGDPAFAGAVYLAASVILLWSCARRLWSDKPETAAVCVLLLVGAGQFVMAGMTAYAMPAHLCFNLLWLRLFLADRRRTDLGAIAIGFIATGLHQPLFHPMFVAPFMLMLLLEWNWRRLVIFVPLYALIGIFWLYWPGHVADLIAGPSGVGRASDSSYIARLLGALSQNRDAFSTMAANLLRFVTWQNILLLPLLLASWPIVRRGGMAAALALGFVLPVLAITIILPSQGFGFGYRYLHGVLGNAVLLAGYGWDRFEGSVALRSALVRATAVSLVVLLPVQGWMTHQLYAANALASARIDASGADYALIPEGNLAVLHDLVLNRPDLSNRPIRLIEPLVADSEDLARRICRRGVTVALFEDSFFDPIAGALEIQRSEIAAAAVRRDRPALLAAGCSVKLLK